MEIKEIEVQQIKPAPYNPRKDLKADDLAMKKLKASVDQWGFLLPLVWNERTGHLVGGHQRLKLIKDRGLEKVVVSVVDLPLAEEKALNVALNKVRGQWDMDRLEALLKELEQEEFDLALTGWDASELRQMLEWSPDFEPVSGEAVPRLDQKDPYVCPECGHSFPRE